AGGGALLGGPDLGRRRKWRSGAGRKGRPRESSRARNTNSLLPRGVRDAGEAGRGSSIHRDRRRPRLVGRGHSLRRGHSVLLGRTETRDWLALSRQRNLAGRAASV